jgi:hypothetical protein
MVRPTLPSARPKRRKLAASAPGILPLSGALAAMPSPLISPALATPSPALRQPLPAPPPMPSRLRATVTPAAPVVQRKQPLKAKTPRIKSGGRP